jgi:nitrite reductase/ring-hydroxylating ferredoxin subunit
MDNNFENESTGKSGRRRAVFITRQNGRLYGINGICPHLKCVL